MRLNYPMNRRLLIILLVVLAFLIPWTVYLAFTLPDHFTAHYWSIAWVGFDMALISVLTVAIWAAYYQRQILVAASIVAATLLICDALFDVVMSLGTPDALLTILSAVAVELPLAIFFIILAQRIMKRTLAMFQTMAGIDNASARIHDASMIFNATNHSSKTKQKQ